VTQWHAVVGNGPLLLFRPTLTGKTSERSAPTTSALDARHRSDSGMTIGPGQHARENDKHGYKIMLNSLVFSRWMGVIGIIVNVIGIIGSAAPVIPAPPRCKAL